MNSAFWAGFRAILPLWFGAVPIGVSYAIAARAAGLSPAETQLMSLAVFSAGAQLSAVNLLHNGVGVGAVILTTLVLNLHQVLLGVTLGRQLVLRPTQRWVAAFLLNDGAYGATITGPLPGFAFLLGAELSMFVVWNVATLGGLLIGQLLPNLANLGLDFVVPLLFLALLIPQLRSRAALYTAVCAGLFAALLARIAPASVAILIAVATASLLGGQLTRPSGEQP